MDPTDRQDGLAGPTRDRADGQVRDADAKAKLDRRAEALRANLRRRKAQGRGRAEAERAGPPD